MKYSGILGTQRTSSGGGTRISDSDTDSDTQDLEDTNADSSNIVIDNTEKVFENDPNNEPKDTVVSADQKDYIPTEKFLASETKTQNATTIWAITYLICAIIIGGTIYLLTKIKYK